MRMDVSKALSQPGQAYPFSCDLLLPSMTVLDDPVSFSAIRVEGEYVGSGEAVSVRAEIVTRVTSRCALCLEPVTQPLICESDETFTRDGAEGTDTYPLDGCWIDLAPYVRDALLLELPLRFLCKEDCKGLCPSCGTNLNTARCTCQEGGKRQNPFSALSELLIKDEEV